MSTPSAEVQLVLCKHCGRRLGASGYYFRCLKCTGTYCYIHQNRHSC